MRPGLRSLVVLTALLGAMAALPNLASSTQITASCSPDPCGAWQARNVTLGWSITPTPPNSEGCAISTLFTTEGTHTRTCSALNMDGDVIATATAFIRIDKTPPRVVAAGTSRPANAAGWFTGPLTVTFTGSDTSSATTTAGIPPGGCSQVPYSGPDSPAASVAGTCRDRAGNVSTPLTQSFKYDATPPALPPLRSVPGDKMVRLLWTRAEGDVELVRSPGVGGAPESVLYRGADTSFVDTRVANLVSYTYRLSTSDPAGNVASQAAGAVADRRILTPVSGARVAAPPVVRWSEVRNASYYNVQLYRGKTKVLTAWPKTTNFRVKKTWKFQRRNVGLTPGTYRLFVWPGFGPFAKQRYGRIVGTRTFVVTK